MRALLIAGFALLASGCGDWRCHTQHTEVSYHHAYTTDEESCYGTGNERHCYSYPVHHPARCVVGDVCDVRCAALDQGRAEAHPNHEPQRTRLVNQDPQLCTDGGQVR